MMENRIYEAGRPTTGFQRGEKITDAAEVQVGEMLIGVSHQFKAEKRHGSQHPHQRAVFLAQIIGCITGRANKDDLRRAEGYDDEEN